MHLVARCVANLCFRLEDLAADATPLRKMVCEVCVVTGGRMHPSQAEGNA